MAGDGATMIHKLPLLGQWAPWDDGIPLCHHYAPWFTSTVMLTDIMAS